MNIKCRIANQHFDMSCEPKDAEAMQCAIDRVTEKLLHVKNDVGIPDSQRQVIIAAILIAFDAEKRDNSHMQGRALSTKEIARLDSLIDDSLAATAVSAQA